VCLHSPQVRGNVMEPHVSGIRQAQIAQVSAVPTYLAQAEAAEFLRVSERTLERWRLEGSGPPYIKAGRRILYRVSDVESWLQARRRSSTSEPLEA
jgi:excisionase family DNA binding protein